MSGLAATHMKRGRGRPPKKRNNLPPAEPIAATKAVRQPSKQPPKRKREHAAAGTVVAPKSPSNSPSKMRALRSSYTKSSASAAPSTRESAVQKEAKKQRVPTQPEVTEAAEIPKAVRKRGMPQKRSNSAQNDATNPSAKRRKTSASTSTKKLADAAHEEAEATSRQPELLPEEQEEINYHFL